MKVEVTTHDPPMTLEPGRNLIVANEIVIHSAEAHMSDGSSKFEVAITMKVPGSGAQIGVVIGPAQAREIAANLIKTADHNEALAIERSNIGEAN